VSELRMRAGQRRRAMTLVLAAAAALTLIFGVGTGAGARTAGYTVSILQTSDPITLDPQRYQGAGNSVIATAYDRLVALGPPPQRKVVPYLATSWKIQPDSVTFKLRKDATCPDGTKITPLVVAQSFTRLVQVPKLNSQMNNLFGPGPYHIKAHRFNDTFTFGTETPFRNLIYGFTTHLASIICPAGIKASQTDLNAMLNAEYGSGPYQLVSFTHGDQLVFQKRKGWHWGPAGSTPPSQLPDKIVFKEIQNATTAANLLLTGGLDIGTITGPDVPRLLAAKSLKHYATQAYGTEPMIFNQRPGRITTDIKVRQALMTAVDPKAWNKAAFGGRGAVVPNLFAPGIECFDTKAAKFMPKPSIDRARQIMISDGYTLSGNTLVKDGKPARVRVALDASTLGSSGEYLQNVYQQVGFDVDNAATDAPGFAQNSLSANFDVAILTVAEATLTPSPGQQHGFTTGPVLPAGFNIANTGAGDPALASNAAVALGTLGKTSCDAFDRLMKIYLQKYYVLPLSSPTRYWFTRGLSINPAGSIRMDISFIKRTK
jgi:peptide/nickel transport system substrate-binding protein